MATRKRNAKFPQWGGEGRAEDEADKEREAECHR
jgi:hypothetical protein